MNNDECNNSTISKEFLTITVEPDIHLSGNEQIHFEKCLSNLFDICHIPLVLNRTLFSVSSFSNSRNINRESIRINHYLRVRQPRKFNWMQITANLIEFHSCKRLPYSARSMIQQIKPILLVYYVEEHLIKLNIRGDNCLLQLIFPSDKNSPEQLQKSIYYKWSDEGHIRSTTIQFNIDYHIEKDHFLI